MVKIILILFLAVTVLSSTAFSLCVKNEPTKEEYADAYNKLGTVPGPLHDFTLADAESATYADKLKQDEFELCVSREEDALRKSGQERYTIAPAGNFAYKFDKITGKTWIATPQGYRELKDTTPRQ